MFPRRPQTAETDFVPGSSYVLPGEGDPTGRGYLFSNDGPLHPVTLGALRARRHGIILEIGQGGLFSTIDQHGLQPVMVDSCQYVVDFCQLVESAILGSTGAAEATERIINEGEDLIEKARGSVTHHGTIASYLAAEASNERMGKLHWTNHFQAVQRALQERPPTYVVSDIRNRDLAKRLQRMSRTYGSIECFNATNVHLPLSEIPGQTMDFLRKLPFARQTIVLYSTRAGGTYTSCRGGEFFSLQRHDERGINAYIKRAHALMPQRNLRDW